MATQLLNSIIETASGVELSQEVSEIELIYISKINACLRPRIRHSEDAERIFRKYWDHHKIGLLEQVYVQYLNRGSRVVAICPLATGGIEGTIVDLRILFAGAIKLNASRFIIAHNHPSGNDSPSAADEKLTRELKFAGEIMRIKLMDHLIITPDNGYYSFGDHGFI